MRDWLVMKWIMDSFLHKSTTNLMKNKQSYVCVCVCRSKEAMYVDLKKKKEEKEEGKRRRKKN